MPVLPVPTRARRILLHGARWTALLGLAAATGCSAPAGQAAGTSTTANAPAAPLRVVTSGPPSPQAGPASAPERGRATVDVPVKALAARLRPDVLVVGKAPLSQTAVTRLTALARSGGAVSFRAGDVTVGGRKVSVVGIDPSTFRAFAAKGTAEATAVWESVARGEAVASHDAAKSLKLGLGRDVALAPVTTAAPRGRTTPAVPAPAPAGPDTTLRLGALATTGIPGSDLIVDDETARELGLPSTTAMLITAGEDVDAVALAGKVRAVTGPGVEVDLLTPPSAHPVAFLTGSRAAKAFGAFSYKYFADGTIEPDARWVSDNIRTETLPIMGRVTCHRLMLPQLRGALQDVVDAGLQATLRTYDGCYVPRFIERNPENSISLHTWGIAIDMDAATNYRGIAGTMDPAVVDIFKRWGFRWGGDWKYTDPMHFELAALLDPPAAAPDDRTR